MAEPFDDNGTDRPTESMRRDQPVPPPDTLVSGTVGDRCVNCGSPLSADQRYCVVCGERRGAPRFSMPDATGAPATPSPAPASARGSRGLGLGAGVLIGGVATLLLAMLVGVLIGHDVAGSNGTKTVASAAPRVIVANGGGSGVAAASSSSSTTPVAGSTRQPKVKSLSKKAAKKTAAQESSAASKVLGGKNAPPATVTVGQKGSGAGFNKKTHKFDGTFFGQ